MDNDLISRQAAIDALGEKPLAWTEGEYELGLQNQWQSDVDALNGLPSAQPEPCEDTVSRQRLLSDLKELVAAWKKYPVMAEQIKGVEAAIGYVEEIPSAQPERKKGKWIYNSPVTMKCNQCGLVIKDWDWHRLKYCPNCLSDMRGEQDE